MSITTYRLEQLRLPYGQDAYEQILATAAARLALKPSAIAKMTVARRSLDVRHRPVWVYGVNIDLTERQVNGSNQKYLRRLPPAWQPPLAPAGRQHHFVVVGAGPAGLSAAHILALGGQRVTLLEQGKKVDERSRDVADLFQKGLLAENSNLCAGEGGAGTFSDGKIYTRRADARVDWFLRQVADLLENPHLAIDYHAHVGTDKLVPLLTRWRQLLQNLGVEFLFEREVKELKLCGQTVAGVVTTGGETIDADGVILALGNSARKLWRRLYEQGVSMEPMTAAMGVRVEHSQAAINNWRYGRWTDLPGLPAAEYFYSAPYNGRPCHTFCMCPGGTVIPTPTEAGGLAVNGMSNSKRGGAFANAAWICEYSVADIGGEGAGPLAIMAFQQKLEQSFYTAGGGAFAAPAQRIEDFLQHRAGTVLDKSSYRRPRLAADMWELLPPWCAEALCFALQKAVAEQPLLRQGQLIGLESRPSNPLRLLRGMDYQAVGFSGLYPCGEGSGYASGITSSALDGILTAEAIIRGQS